MFHPKPAVYQLPESEVEMSWSENTTPDYDDIEEIIRTAPSRLSVPADSRIRIMREPIKKRRRIDEAPRGSWQGRVFHEFAQPLNVRCSMDGSDESNLSALTIITSASSSVGDPWSASGHIEEEGEDGGADWDQEGEDAEGERDGEEEGESLVLPKIEPIDDDTVDMGDVKEASIPDSPEQPQLKRPRGRPRKHPKPTPESLAKVAKGRSKTGCITCRRRKKKCDEAKPRCMNCEKNNVRCEGYPDRKIWQSGKEKAEEEGTISTRQYWTCQQDAEELIVSTARMRRVSLPTIKLQSLIHGVDTDGDRLFFRHYIYRLSSIFTLEGERKNAFKDMILPLAIRNQGLMHSILALAGRHINYRSSYGVQLLKDHPNVKESELEERSDFHKQEAMKLFLLDCDRQQRGEDQGDDIVSARFGQMICMVMDTLSNPDPRGDHRLHLQAYQRLIKERPPADGEFLNFIREFFDYHISMDDLIFLPSPTALEFSIDATDEEEDSFESLETEIPGPSTGVRMLGVCDGLFHLMSHITKMRNTIRDNIRKGIDPPVVYSHLWKGAELDIAIRRWEPAMTPDHPSYPAALMYKQMAWVYLWRTIYPPIPGSSTPPNSKIKVAVDQGLEILKTFGPNDPSQTLLLGPIFMLGCASFEECQRKEVRKAISVVKTYMQYRNSDSALEVLEEMWRRMDRGDASSWDWQRVSREMGRDFLAT